MEYLLQVVCQGLSETVSSSWVLSFSSFQSLEMDTFAPNYNICDTCGYGSKSAKYTRRAATHQNLGDLGGLHGRVSSSKNGRIWAAQIGRRIISNGYDEGIQDGKVRLKVDATMMGPMTLASWLIFLLWCTSPNMVSGLVCVAN